MTETETETEDHPSDSPADRILVVEDDRVNQQVLAAMLDKMGLCTDLAENGDQAVRKCRERRYRLVLMDLQMPVMNGLEAARVIRQQSSGDSWPVIIATTARVLPQDRRECLEAGMDDFVAKPFTGLQLQTVLQRWVELVPWFRAAPED